MTFVSLEMPFEVSKHADKPPCKNAQAMAPRKPQNETIGERLRRLRREHGLSQRQLAAPGVTAAYISRIEAGMRQPSVKALRLLARRLDVSPDYLETGMDVREEHERELRLADAELELRLNDDIAAAEQHFRALLDEAVAAHDAHAATRARVGIGFAAVRKGDYAEAVSQLEEGLASGRLSPLSNPDVYTALAHARAALGTPRRGVELLERCLTEVREQAPDDVASEVRYATYLSYALTDVGDLERAQKVIQDVLRRAQTIADPYARVHHYWSRGRLAANRNDVAFALEQFRKAVSLLEATEDTLQLGRAHLACAQILVDDDRATEAATHLQLAERLLGPNVHAQDLARLRTEQAKVAERSGDADEAIGRAREALEVLGEAQPTHRARALTALAEAHARRGETDAACDAFALAAGIFESHGRLQEAAATCRAWGAVLRKEGRGDEALDVLDRAAAFAAQSGSARPRSFPVS
jgi:transcriptional regulator with XRE-family HTH domain